MDHFEAIALLGEIGGDKAERVAAWLRRNMPEPTLPDLQPVERKAAYAMLSAIEWHGPGAKMDDFVWRETVGKLARYGLVAPAADGLGGGRVAASLLEPNDSRGWQLNPSGKRLRDECRAPKMAGGDTEPRH